MKISTSEHYKDRISVTYINDRIEVQINKKVLNEYSHNIIKHSLESESKYSLENISSDSQNITIVVSLYDYNYISNIYKIRSIISKEAKRIARLLDIKQSEIRYLTLHIVEIV